MKKVLMTFYFLSTVALAATPALNTKIISERFENYANQTSKELEGDVMKDVEAFADLKLNPNSDLKLVKNVLVTLIKLDQEDPSRTAVMILGPSYGKNSKLYKTAFALVKDEKNKPQVEEIENLMETFSKIGNGQKKTYFKLELLGF